MDMEGCLHKDFKLYESFLRTFGKMHIFRLSDFTLLVNYELVSGAMGENNSDILGTNINSLGLFGQY